MKPLFEILHRDRSSKARTGRLFLPHGSVETPVFMPVGTAGTVKAMNHGELERIGWRLMLSNTYHLYLRPGAEVISAYGSLHGFNSWRHNILTDSGGFQVFSLAPFRKVRREGVRFRSHIDGSYHTLTPESVVDFQTVLNSDIQMVLDVCSEKGISEKKAKEAAYITAEWARRAKSRWLQKKEEGYEGELFGIVQGNFYKDLRKMSAEITNEIDFPGVAIGGLSVGEEKNEFGDFLAYTAALLPDGKPRYVMGIRLDFFKKGALCVRSAADFGGVHLLGVSELQPRLPASFGESRRNFGIRIDYRTQFNVVLPVDGADPSFDPGRAFQ